MKRLLILFLSPILVFVFVLSSAQAVLGQESRLPDEDIPQMRKQDARRSKTLLQQLDLTADQIQQIRSINQETRGLMREAAQRQRRARFELDAAIYSETANEKEVERLAREFAQAQTELTRLRSKTEFRIRKVLNPAQIVRFRELRQNAGEEMRRRRDRPFPGQNRRNRRLAPQ